MFLLCSCFTTFSIVQDYTTDVLVFILVIQTTCRDRQLHNSIEQLEKSCKEINYEVLPSTINYKRKSKFIKSNSNTFKSHKKVG